jgi:hypothetical protein
VLDAVERFFEAGPVAASASATDNFDANDELMLACD